MADTSIQKKVEKWICNNYLVQKYGQLFKEKKIELSWGGKYNFDAVSEDESIVVNI